MLPEVMTVENRVRLSELDIVYNLFLAKNIDVYLMGSWAVSALNGAFV